MNDSKDRNEPQGPNVPAHVRVLWSLQREYFHSQDKPQWDSPTHYCLWIANKLHEAKRELGRDGLFALLIEELNLKRSAGFLLSIDRNQDTKKLKEIIQRLNEIIGDIMHLPASQQALAELDLKWAAEVIATLPDDPIGENDSNRMKQELIDAAHQWMDGICYDPTCLICNPQEELPDADIPF